MPRLSAGNSYHKGSWRNLSKVACLPIAEEAVIVKQPGHIDRGAGGAARTLSAGAAPSNRSNNHP
jgi:hypothetical protein